MAAFAIRRARRRSDYRSRVCGELLSNPLNHVLSDAPKTLAELQQNAGTGRPGYEDYHIVEQGAGRHERFSRSQIDGADNVVSVPTYKHHEITGWYNKPNKNFGMQTPRDYLRGKDWSEHVSVGHQAMREIGVLK